MLVQLDTDQTPRTLTKVTQIDVDGTTVRDLKELWQNDANGVPRLIFSSFSGSMTASPNFVAGYGYSHAFIHITTESTTVSSPGGSPPITYVWSFDDVGWTAVTPGSSTTAFRSPTCGPSSSLITNATCTATDANGSVATVSVALSVSNNGS